MNHGSTQQALKLLQEKLYQEIIALSMVLDVKRLESYRANFQNGKGSLTN